jgi:hypothetical protein
VGGCCQHRTGAVQLGDGKFQRVGDEIGQIMQAEQQIFLLLIPNEDVVFDGNKAFYLRMGIIAFGNKLLCRRHKCSFSGSGLFLDAAAFDEMGV